MLVQPAKSQMVFFAKSQILVEGFFSDEIDTESGKTKGESRKFGHGYCQHGVVSHHFPPFF